MRLTYKVWLDQNGKVFGDGPYELLKYVEQTGSLRNAALQLGMSYNKAWNLIRNIEQRLGFTLIEGRSGGDSGGGSTVTPEALRLMDKYRIFREEVNTALNSIYKKHFAQNDSRCNEF